MNSFDLLTQEHHSDLKLQNQQLISDNLILSNQVTRLRGIVDHYEHQNAEYLTLNQMHKIQIRTVQKATEQINQKFDESSNKAEKYFSTQINGLKKDVLPKKVDIIQKKLEVKAKKCRELQEFKDKICRLRASWEHGSVQCSNDELFQWLYCQLLRGKGKGKPTARASSLRNQHRKPLTEKKENNLERSIS